MTLRSVFNRHLIKGTLKKGLKNGFFHILGGNTLVKVISALSVLLFPRIMGSDYGPFKLADDILAYLLIANGLGMQNVILRYCAAFDTPEEQNGYFTFAVKFGMIADVGILAVFSGALYIPEIFGIRIIRYGAENILAMMLFTVFFDFLFNAAQCFLRTNRENKKFARNSVIFSALYALIPVIFSLVFRLFGRTMEGAVIGRYIAYAVTMIFVFASIRLLPAFKAKGAKLKREEKTGAVKYSLNALLASAFSLIMPLNESIVLSIMVTNNLYSDFKVAQIVPQSIQFIASSVIVYIFPYYAKNYLDGKWILKNTKKVIFGMSALMGIIAIVGIILSPEIVLIYGSRFKTASAVHLMRVFFITFAINSAIRMPIGNILAAVGEVRFNVANAIFSSTVHLGICWSLTYTFGIDGAAYGLLIGYIISSVASIIYLKYYCGRLERRKDKTSISDEKGML
jgi:O-antigen/teichoic acid export membrane protein